MVTISAAKEAETLKQDGNIFFSRARYLAAIEAYTQAITLCPNVPVYWTNRALCHRKRSDWKRVEEDCRRAIELDNNSLKAHYMLGLALHNQKEYTGAVKELERALDLVRDADAESHKVEEIWQELADARYLLWEEESSKRSWELQNLKEACEEALKEKHMMDPYMEGFIDKQADTHLKRLEALEKVFEKAAEDDTPTEVPDHLCCRISLEIFRDPVITPYGITYERAVLLDHLKKVGMFDPVTRKPLDSSQLIPNLAIKEAVQVFLNNHGWAYRSS